MPTYKYSSVEQMKGGRVHPRLDPDNIRVACELSELAYRFRPWRLEPGVRKYRSIAEANASREQWVKRQASRR